MQFLVVAFSFFLTLVILPLLFMVCFNAVIPGYFGTQAMTFWQSLAVIIMARILLNVNPLGVTTDGE